MMHVIISESALSLSYTKTQLLGRKGRGTYSSETANVPRL